MKGKTKLTIGLLLLMIVMAISPLLLLKDAEFGGSDDAGSAVVSEVLGEEYEPWFTPPIETILGGELPGEVESMIFCVQTGIGVGILAYGFGYFKARKKYKQENP